MKCWIPPPADPEPDPEENDPVVVIPDDDTDPPIVIIDEETGEKIVVVKEKSSNGWLWVLVVLSLGVAVFVCAYFCRKNKVTDLE